MTADDDIIGHTDILSSPLKKGRGQANVHYGRTPVTIGVVSRKRRQSPRKDVIEKVKVPVTTPQEEPKRGYKGKRRGRKPKSNHEESSKDLNQETNQTTPDKKIKVEFDLKISADNILPTRTRRHTRVLPKDLSEDEDEDEDVKPPVKKKRGRPKKIVTHVKEEEHSRLEISPPVVTRKRKSRKRSISPDDQGSSTETDIMVPDTPTKEATSILMEQSFTSPLKKVILSNLKEYKQNVSFKNLKLSKNFVPTRLPNTYTPQHVKQLQNESVVSNFLDTFEGYFDQRKSLKRSKNTMSMAPTVTREEFATITNLFNKKFQRSSKDKLEALQKQLYPQYWFELSRGFTLLFYGVGSKRAFMEDLAINYVSIKCKQYEIYDNKRLNKNYKNNDDTGVPCVTINGYNPTCNYRDILKDITDIIFPEEKVKVDSKYWGNHSMLYIQKMAEYYRTQPNHVKIILVIHNLDGPSLKKNIFQRILGQLATIKQIAIIASVDHIYAPLLWDATKSQNYNFIFHNVTNYEASDVESSFQDVMKLGKEESTTGAEGAKFVLESLTVNAKKLYKLLLETQMANMEIEMNGKVAPIRRGIITTGVDFKKFHDMCASEFIVSNEVSLRTILKEFIDHKMAFIKKRNNKGFEVIWVAYSYGEMKKLLDTALASIS
ncbi:similar to Saccharomyces cerevisiae YBR060C ORC2 Subunit of the origin recognition complex [Maudiozyma barnettii]|uniref:Origin recognition complex subunit 2 n=1 Tax=Maudiozyma barnettii TaxID=61262 RepID=A0A8H2ZIG6_9SACH|nr:origin recognition complex subunit 2 [Kazachstania barnettii]CAB4255893.1 similar to Saccharomyces cerevisiae YBR060C ORC2 Subunit of the origin recognition complex [Kazachstania barnettii]CAD1784453.1 similar to Saccharomyces cerevisiae YBR060C ORC2 Subunit of the origin recognition complex [Kazachstania barnettii]